MLITTQCSAIPWQATVTSGQARFTVLTPQLIRMEWATAAGDAFEDRPSLAFVRRNTPVPKFSHSVAGGVLTIATANLTLTYTVGQPFSAATLAIKGASGTPAGSLIDWRYGMTSAADPGNLLGTPVNILQNTFSDRARCVAQLRPGSSFLLSALRFLDRFRTLDQTKVVSLNCTVNGGEKVHPHCEFGLVSRSGWALVDDTGVPVLDDVADWWTDASGKMLRNADAQDLYFFGHGHAYTQALKDYSVVGGSIPVFPRYSSGVWWTRWYDFTAQDSKRIVDDYNSRGIPLDVFIWDMDWHKKNDWTGYSWDPSLFPFPADTVDYMHARGLHTGANLHDASGMNSWETQFPAFCAAMGLDAATTTKAPFTLTNKSYVLALEDQVLKPLMDDGGPS